MHALLAQTMTRRRGGIEMWKRIIVYSIVYIIALCIVYAISDGSKIAAVAALIGCLAGIINTAIGQVMVDDDGIL